MKLSWAALLAVAHLSDAYSNFTKEKAEVHALTSTALVDGIAKLTAREIAARANGTEPTCTHDKLAFRREYGALSHAEKLDYVKAVQCLQALPPRTPANVSSGARSRFDDFVVVHIQQTLDIHFSGIFMPWHRWFTYSYEKALREECGYKGYQPYWDWPKYAAAPQDSPIFDGSETSLGGNGDFIPHEGPLLVSPTNASLTLQLEPGVGSGNVTTGPFANMTVNLGPFGGLNNTAPGPDGGLGYNPRRLKRDVGPAVNERYANYSTVLSESCKHFCFSANANICDQTFCRSQMSRSIASFLKVFHTLRLVLMVESTMSLVVTQVVIFSLRPVILRSTCTTA